MTQILFLTNNSMTDAIAYVAVCLFAMKTKTSVTVVNVYDGHHHDDIENVFALYDDVTFICHSTVFADWLDPYEMDQVDWQFGTLRELAVHLEPHVDHAALVSLLCLYGSEFSPHLPSVLAYMLFRRLGLIEFGHFVAGKLSENAVWDICRDREVIDILHPKSPPHTEERYVPLP